MKPLLWVSMEEYKLLGPEHFEAYEIGIDLTRGNLQKEHQADYEEYCREMSLGGQTYDPDHR